MHLSQVQFVMPYRFFLAEGTQLLSRYGATRDGTYSRVTQGLYVDGVDGEEVELDEGKPGRDGVARKGMIEFQGTSLCPPPR